MSPLALPIQDAMVTATAVLCALIGVFATLRRGHWLQTLLFSAAFMVVAAYEAALLGVLRADTSAAARTWASSVLGISALASWLWLGLSVVLARPQPMQQLVRASAYLALALAGCVAMFFLAGTPYVVREMVGVGGNAVLVLGDLGKVYLIYLVVVLVAIVMNLEGTLRSAPASTQRRLRAVMVALVLGAVASLVVVAMGLLSDGIRVVWLSAAAAPKFLVGSVTALALARRRLSDMSVPVARPVIYFSSVSLTIAGVFLLVMAGLSKLLPALPPEWKRGAVLLLMVGFALALVVFALIPRASRGIRRFIDRNFYSNRFDYRREWERVSRTLVPSARPQDLYRQVESLASAVFETERIVIHLRDPVSGEYRCVFASTGLAPEPLEEPLRPDNPLIQRLAGVREPLVFRAIRADLDLIPAAAENRELVKAIGAELCAPLFAGDDRVGLLWLSEKRIDEDYSAEDVEFLGTMAPQLGAALRFAHLAGELAETRQFESMHRLSSYVLHDIKNQVSGLSLMLGNARRHISDPEFQRDAMRVVERTVGNLKELMTQMSAVSRPVRLRPVESPVHALFASAAQAAGMAEGTHAGITFRIECDSELCAMLDTEQMARVLTNLLVNAREALEGPGVITLEAVHSVKSTNGELLLQVHDDGRGMTDEFVRNSLFRPFSTTKSAGLGIGLAHSKSIVEAHGGTIVVRSAPGRGTTFEVRVPRVAAARVLGGEA
ncbi:MAG: PEP-CTERM system histidine kinase PrsK [Candidatus Eisenbacteria bacterium]|uniref:histidine kinase n=1 Tax=Eiseniibacteriota bacterium TaxID=2212470 RepID=A0A849SDU5_UNCEI|nr:PEP-CTERM system histidine kinase PrsK [Candidatus Eisenbacteria bacterium]